jgi:hypothetical protein
VFIIFLKRKLYSEYGIYLGHENMKTFASRILNILGLAAGPLFRRLIKGGNCATERLTAQSVSLVLKSYARDAGLNAAAIREESERMLLEASARHHAELGLVRQSAEAAEEARVKEERNSRLVVAQQELERGQLLLQNVELCKALNAQSKAERERAAGILQSGFNAGGVTYRWTRWVIAVCFGLTAGIATYISTDMPVIATCLSGLLGLCGFWFVPNILHAPLQLSAVKTLRHFVSNKDSTIVMPVPLPDFRNLNWPELDAMRLSAPAVQAMPTSEPTTPIDDKEIAA